MQSGLPGAVGLPWKGVADEDVRPGRSEPGCGRRCDQSLPGGRWPGRSHELFWGSDCKLAGTQRSKGSLLVATGGFQDDQGRLVLEEKIGEFADAFRVVGKSPGFLGVPESQIEMGLGDVYAGKDLGRS